jgi:hypothetical protein
MGKLECKSVPMALGDSPLHRKAHNTDRYDKLGIFLCMRCAALHRKMGTHITKVKSLSMDSWSTEQVEVHIHSNLDFIPSNATQNMKRVGNVASNRIYNPQNAKPAIPFDADEADSAMERFIRQKYQDPAVKTQIRQNTGSTNSDDHPPPLPPKTGSRFGFRSASSIFPLSSKARREAAARPSSSDRSPSPPRRNKQSKLFGADVGQPNAHDFESRMAKLQDMGFRDERQNLTVLKRVGGDMEKAIETLVKLGDGQNSVGKSIWRQDLGLSSGSRTPMSATGGISVNPTREKSLPQPSSNPFDMLDTPPAPAPPQSSQSTGTLAHPQSQMMGSNPFQQNSNSVGLGPSQSQYSLNQAFQNMTISAPSQPLFPNHTGGFPGQQQQQQLLLHMQSMTPPVPSIPQQYYPPVIYENPAQQPQQSYNPFMQQQQRQPPPLNTNLQSNPYAQNQAPFSAPVSNMQPTIFHQQQQTPQATGVNVQKGPYAQQQQASHNPVQTPTGQATAFYGNNTPQQAPQQYSQQNPFLQNNTQQAPQQSYTSQPQQLYTSQPQQQNPYQQFQGNMNALVSQQTGRADKRSILELYNYPQLAPTPLQQQQAQNQGPLSAPLSAPTFDTQQQQRSISGPLSAGFGGSRNPFTGGGGGVQSAGGDLAGGAGRFSQAGARHTSQESVSVNAGDWQNGRHSPDAWGTISARSMR